MSAAPRVKDERRKRHGEGIRRYAFACESVSCTAGTNAAGFLEDPKWLSATRSTDVRPDQWHVTPEEERRVEDQVEAWFQRRTRAELTQLALPCMKPRTGVVLTCALGLAPLASSALIRSIGSRRSAKGGGDSRVKSKLRISTAAKRGVRL